MPSVNDFSFHETLEVRPGSTLFNFFDVIFWNYMHPGVTTGSYHAYLNDRLTKLYSTPTSAYFTQLNRRHFGLPYRDDGGCA